MDAFVVVSTKGRLREVKILLESLQRQTLTPERCVVVGSAIEDVAGLENFSSVIEGTTEVVIAPVAGISVQRNVGVARILASVESGRPFFIAFFDDDFRPADDWLESAEALFTRRVDVVGVTGRVLADGINGIGLSEDEAVAYLCGALSPESHWASGSAMRDVNSVYGCNMAFTEPVVRNCKFDEELVLYGWQEDRDYSGQARRYGHVVYAPSCLGVHLGIKNARTSGVRLGYSQIVNPIYMTMKGTTNLHTALRFVGRAILSNLFRTITRDGRADYSGRMSGNFRAISDLVRGQCQPRRAASLGRKET
jgi:GT2 family glycosyltransferase